MRQCDRVLATGGGAMVAAAYSSGTPALGMGVGNAVIVVDSSANLEDAADKIVVSKTLDLAASCSADNSVVAVEGVHDQLLEKLISRGGYVLDGDAKAKLQAVLWLKKCSLKTLLLVPVVLGSIPRTTPPFIFCCPLSCL